ncbi:sodium:solute symporter [Capsulimonas corticalis]|uniref:Sodium:solute symporter n=1 Tax=Capsulimonas corticalis TaxID=2219043 RepID=A0A402D4L4_9BACT|nr:sodium:solute symporter family protein [Capsulimonas corticalis]BDI29291.1 sodium:solute symporter [Capsulimonas corticalis]
MPHIHMGAVDYALLVIYIVFVLGIGVAVKRLTKTSGDFFLSGRSIPAWITGLAFLSANLGAQEVIGMGASGAKYGIATSHFYWIGAIPAMVFVALFMMPFYYGSKARSVPEYLRLRFDEKTRAFNAGSFAIMTLFSSGISLYAMASLLELLLRWNFLTSILVSSGIVLAYVFLGGLKSAIYNEVLQFFLIVFGFFPVALLGLKDIGGWSGLQARLSEVSIERGFGPGGLTHAWQGLATTHNPLGVEWFSLVMGLGFVLSFGYWCTDFLVIQRAMAADSEVAARRTPLVAAVPKMLFPFLVILPGMIAMALTAHSAQTGFALPRKPDGTYNYDLAAPMMLIHYYPTGLLGLGMTALLASFMSGMAGNVTAFNTVFTVDIYESYIKPGQSDEHYLEVGRYATVGGVLFSIATAFLAANFNNIMDLLQLVFAFVNAPLFATFLLGMFWKRTTGHGAFWGLLSGTLAAAAHHGLTQPIGAASLAKGGWLGAVVHHYPSEMAQNFWTAIFAWTVCFLATILISLLTRQTKTDQEMEGLVYSLTKKPVETDLAWYARPAFLGGLVLAAALVLNIIFR